MPYCLNEFSCFYFIIIIIFFNIRGLLKSNKNTAWSQKLVALRNKLSLSTSMKACTTETSKLHQKCRKLNNKKSRKRLSPAKGD